MAYIITFSLNREQVDYHIVESLDELPSVIADHVTIGEDYDSDYLSDLDARSFDLIDIFEIGSSLKTDELLEKIYDDAQVKIAKYIKDSIEEGDKRLREVELRELKRLKAIYEK